MWDPKGKVSQDSLVFPTQGGRLLVILSIHSWSWESDKNNGIRRILCSPDHPKAAP